MDKLAILIIGISVCMFVVAPVLYSLYGIFEVIIINNIKRLFKNSIR